MSRRRPFFAILLLITLLMSSTLYRPQTFAQDSRQRYASERNASERSAPQRVAPLHAQAVQSEIQVPQASQDTRDMPDPTKCCSGKGKVAAQAGPRCGSSPFNPPEMNDATFVV